jgi:hypothetical protein
MITMFCPFYVSSVEERQDSINFETSLHEIIHKFFFLGISYYLQDISIFNLMHRPTRCLPHLIQRSNNKSKSWPQPLVRKDLLASSSINTNLIQGGRLVKGKVLQGQTLVNNYMHIIARKWIQYCEITLRYITCMAQFVRFLDSVCLGGCVHV